MSKLFFLTALLLGGLSCLSAQTRYFEFRVACGHGNWQDTSFIAAASDTALINSVLTELSKPLEERRFINGPIAYNNGGHNKNADHTFLWHFIPDQWELTDLAVEVCSGCPFSDLDRDTTYWVGQLGYFCPWSSLPVREVSNPVTGIDDRLPPIEVRVFPNPAKNMLYVEMEEQEPTFCEVYNATGQQVAAYYLDPFASQLDLSALESGLYFFRFKNIKGAMVKKVMIAP